METKANAAKKRPTSPKKTAVKRSANKPRRDGEHYTVQEVIAHAIDTSTKTMHDLALEAGYESHQMLSMLRAGRTKLALNRVQPVALALGIDPEFLLRLTLRERLPEVWDFIAPMLDSFRSDAEREIIEIVRNEADGLAVKPMTDEQVESFRNMIADWKQSYLSSTQSETPSS